MAANAITNTNTPLSVFITGATGALGREVTRQLKAAGHRVTGATNGYENAALVRADGGIPAYPSLMRAGEIRSILTAAKVDVVINLAPQAANHLPQQPTHWDTALMDEGVSALIEACQSAGVKFLVHTSYAFADEDSEALEGLLHSVKAGEQKVLKGSVPACVLRMGFVYGAESPELIATRDTLLMGRMIDGGPDNSHACWINAPDAARAVILAALQRPAGALLTIVEDQAASPASFMTYFADSQGVTRPGRAPRFAAWAQPKADQVALMSLNPHVSSADAKDKLGWSPRFANYHQGIDDVLLSLAYNGGCKVMLKAVLFDLDDTLIDWSDFDHNWPALERKHLRLLFDYVGAEIQPIENFDAYCAEFGTRMADAWTSARSTMRAPNLGTVLIETTAAFGVPAERLDTRRCLQAYDWGIIPGTKMFPEVPQTLTLLREHGLKIGIVTNAHQPMWIRDIEITAHGLFDFFPDCRIAAADVGYLKPHPLIFQTALRCVGTKPEETVFVGDDPDADIVGAQSAGLKAVLRRLPRRPFTSETITPDAFISRLDELPRQLDTWYPGWR